MSDNPEKPAILFVDDEELSRKYFRRFFSKSWEVIVAAEGQEGLQQYLDNSERIGIVVTDQMMPETTGLELLEELVARGASVVRVLSTAYADSVEVADAVERGLVDFFISKPWDIPELESVLEQAEQRWQAHFASAA